MARLTNCFFCKKELIVPSEDECKPLKDLEDLEVFDEYKKEPLFTLFGEFSCKECYYKRVLPFLIK